MAWGDLPARAGWDAVPGLGAPRFTVSYIAECDGSCGNDAVWTSQLRPDEHYVLRRYYKVVCRRCGIAEKQFEEK